MASNTGSPYFIPFPEDTDPVDVAGDFETLATHLNDNLEEIVSDTIGVLVTGNTENGIVVTVDDNTNKINFDVNDPVISLSGDVAGSATMTNLSNTDIAVTIQPNSVELGTDTTGPYVATITGTENQIDVLGSGTEDSDVILSLPQDIDTGAEPTFAGGTLGEIQVGITGDNEIDTATGNLTIDSQGGTTTLDDDVVISGKLEVPNIDFTTSGIPSALEGRIFYDTEVDNFSYYDDTQDKINVNEELFIYAKNNGLSEITKGKIVFCGGFEDETSIPLVRVADNTIAEEMPAIGAARESIPAGGYGKIVINGRIDGVDTSSFQMGSLLYVGTNGNFTQDRPTLSASFQVIGKVGKADATDGCVFIFADPVADLVPNLPEFHVWVGDANYHAVATPDPTVDNLTLNEDLAVNGGDITTTATTFNLVNDNATAVNFAGAGIDIQIGSSEGTTNVNNDLDVDGDVNIDGADLTTNSTSFNLLNDTATSINFAGAATTLEIGAATGTTNVNNNLDVDGDLNVDGGDITTTATTFNVVNDTATTVNIGGEATAVNIGDSTGTTTVSNDLQVDGSATIDGNLTVHGTTTTINSVVSTTDDPVFVIGGDTLPETDDNKDRGIEFRWHDGSDPKTGFFGFDDSTGRFTFIPEGTNNSEVFTGTLGDIEVNDLYVAGIVPAGGTLNISDDLDVDGDLNVDGGDFTTGATTFNLLNDTATTVNFAGAATDIQIGSVFGTTNINNDLDVDGDINVDGGDLTVSTSVFNLANDTATTINFGGAATDIQIGSSSGTTNVNNDLDVDGDINIDGGDLTASTSTFNLLHTPTTINFGAAATDIQIGAATGTTNINNDLDVDGDVNIDGGDLTVSTETFNLANDTATTVNFAGSATDVQIGAATGTTNINNNLDVDGDVSIDGGDLTATSTNFNLLNDTVTTLNFAGAATDLTIGGDTGNTTVRNNLIVSNNLTINGGTTTFNPPTTSAPFTIGANAINQLVVGLNSDLLDGQTGSWYQSRANHTGTQVHTTISDWTEATQDVVGPMFAHDAHSNLIAEYNDITGRVILTAPGLGSGFGDSAGVTAAQMYWFGV